jgi:filamentous hemagglutinin family protein
MFLLKNRRSCESPVARSGSSKYIVFLTMRSLWFSLAACSIALTATPGQAQLVPDNTLGAENSQVVPTDATSDRVEGGAVRGANLFHSFSQFNIDDGRSLYFANPTGIETIFTRVTGGETSSILGTLGVLGDANLFLLNPNGLVFGPNARLDLRGAFVATTAAEILFDNGEGFGAIAPQNAPLLTVNVPTGLQFGSDRAAIVNRSRVTDATGATVGLQVEPGQTLGLFGGDLTLDGGYLTARQGAIALGSVGPDSQIALDGLTPNYTNANNFSDIFLADRASVSTSGAGGGRIDVRGRQVTLSGGAQIQANTLGSQQGGTLTVTASERVELRDRLADGTPSALQTRVEPGATGSGGNLSVDTRVLRIEGGARVATSSLSETPVSGGNLAIRASEAVELLGIGQFPDGTPAPSQISAVTAGPGDAGTIAIATGRLTVTDGAQVTSETFDAGDAGTVRVTAEEVRLSGRSPDGLEPSGVLARVNLGATGNAGNLELFVDRLRVEGGARVAASSLGAGNGGNIEIRAAEAVEAIGFLTSLDGTPNTTNSSQISALTTGSGNAGNVAISTPQLLTTRGAQVVASTFGRGNAGRLTVTGFEANSPAESVVAIGRSADNLQPSGLLARVEVAEAIGNAEDITVVARRIAVLDGARLAAASRGIGNAGNVRLQVSRSLEVADGGEISVRGLDNGSPGNLEIAGIPGDGQADVSLTRRGSLAAASENGQGGSIAIRARDIFVQEDSQILATGSASGNPTLEGNIDLESEILLLRDRSFLGTDAANPQGGSNVRIGARTTFVSPDSTIVAAGDLTLDIELEVDPAQVSEGEVVDPEALIAQNPCRQGDESEFVVTGRGGVPPNPGDPLVGDLSHVDPIELSPPSARPEAIAPPETIDRDRAIVAAQGWHLDERGRVVLTAGKTGTELHWVNPLPGCND